MIKKGWLLFLALLLTAGFAGTSYAASHIDFSGQVRIRPEYRDNRDWTDTISDDAAFVEQRTRITANATVSDDVSAKVTLQDSRIWGSEPNTASTGMSGVEVWWNDDILKHAHAFDMKEGYLQVGNLLGSGITLRAGRQVISKGDQRILGGFEWNNHSRSFDGIALVHSNDQATVTAAWVKVHELNYTLNTMTGFIPGISWGGSDDDTDLWAAYAEVNVIPNNQIDVYAILARDGDVSVGLKPVSLYTIGARVDGDVEDVGIDYTVEVPFQFGDDSTAFVPGTNDSFGGYAVFVKAGYTVPGENKIRLGGEYNYGSGDNTADADTEQFIDMGLGTNHMHYGYMDINGNTVSNRTHWGLNASAQVTPELNLYAAYWGHKLNEVSPGVDDDLGGEINIQAKYDLAAGTKVVLGYGYGIPGGNQDQSAPGGSADGQNWGFMILNTNF